MIHAVERVSIPGHLGVMLRRLKALLELPGAILGPRFSRVLCLPTTTVVGALDSRQETMRKCCETTEAWRRTGGQTPPFPIAARDSHKLIDEISMPATAMDPHRRAQHGEAGARPGGNSSGALRDPVFDEDATGHIPLLRGRGNHEAWMHARFWHPRNSSPLSTYFSCSVFTCREF